MIFLKLQFEEYDSKKKEHKEQNLRKKKYYKQFK